MQRAPLSEENRVIVRYWPGAFSSFKINSTGSLVSFGHVSLQTFIGGPDNQGYYISFWRADIDKRCCGKQEDHIHGREEDLQYSGQANIENTFTLYTLNAKAINAAYEEMLRKGLKWDLGGSLLHSQDENIAVCSSLIYRLLVAGGIGKLVSENERLFLGLFDTARIALLGGIPSSFYLVPKIIDVIQNLRYTCVTFSCAKNICKSEQWGYYAYLPNLTDGEKYIHDTPSHGHSYWFYYNENPVMFFKVINDVREKYGWLASGSVVTLVILAGFLMMSMGQRTASNYLIMKPGDLQLLMKRAVAAELRLPRSGVMFFDRGGVSSQMASNPAPGRPALV